MATNPDERIEQNQLARIEQNQLARIEQLEAELETERTRLAACGVVAMANTPESAAKAREMLPQYRSASCDDVALAVDREMSLRAERDELVAALRYLAEAILTRADADYMKRQMDEAVRVLDLHGITPPVPYSALANGEK